MLRITLDEEARPAMLKLGARLAGAWVEELERSWRQAAESDRPRLLDLSEVTLIDLKGIMFLTSLVQEGVKLRGGRLMIRFILSQVVEDSTAMEEISVQS